MRALRRGDRGREVVDLQTRLVPLVAVEGLGNRGIDGVFGPITERAVRAFQQEAGLLADGVVGPITWREIVEAGYEPGERYLYLHQPPYRGADVLQLQRMLNDLGFDPGAVNGVFDERTTRALKDFQRNAGLEPDGVVDAGVFKVLHVYAGQTLGTHQLPDKNEGYFPEDLFSGAVVLDAAHGGRDRGYVCPRTRLAEADLNLAVVQELAQILPAREVLLTRDWDRDVPNAERAVTTNEARAKMVVSVHHAHHKTPTASGTASFYFERAGYRSHRGQRAAEYVQKGVSQALDTRDIGGFGRSYDILRETNIPAVMVEPLFLTNERELEVATDPYYPATVAAAIAGALELYAGRDQAFIAVG